MKIGERITLHGIELTITRKTPPPIDIMSLQKIKNPMGGGGRKNFIATDMIINPGFRDRRLLTWRNRQMFENVIVCLQYFMHQLR